MRFSSFFVLATAGFALAAPSPKEEHGALEVRQQSQTLVSTLNDATQILESTVLSNTESIATLLDQIKNSVNATVVVQLSALIEANYQNIFNAIGAATNAIAGVTTGAAGGLLNSVRGLTQAQINSLVASIARVGNAIRALSASLTLTGTNLAPALQLFLVNEVAGIKNALVPLLTPLAVLLNTIRTAQLGGSVAVQGVGELINSIVGVLQGVLSSLGLPIPS